MEVHPVQVPATEIRLACGLATGTHVMTLRGEVRVEDIRPGDRVVSRNRGAVRVDGVDSGEEWVVPVRIAVGFRTSRLPLRDLVVGPGTPLLVRSAPAWSGTALVAAVALVDGHLVATGREQYLVLHRLLFGEPQIIYAEGLELQA